MVLHGEELHVKIKHIGMRQGNMVVKVETNNDRDVEVLEGTAEAAQPPTSSVFAGQGPQESGMGMELYNNSPAARAVWDAADAHLLAVYDFSIKIVKDNPGGGGIHFGGTNGRVIRSRCTEITYDIELVSRLPGDRCHRMSTTVDSVTLSSRQPERSS